MYFTNSLVAFYWEDHGDVVLIVDPIFAIHFK